MPDPTCELCGDATPARLVRTDPARGWDTLCPGCWMLNVPADARDAGAPAPLEAAYDAAVASQQADFLRYCAQMERNALQSLGNAYGLGRALTLEECATRAQRQALQQQALSQYAQQWQAQQRDAAFGGLGGAGCGGLGGSPTPGQASGLFGGLFGGLC